MKVWTNTGCEGRWPVGFAAVVVANTAEEAAYILNTELQEKGLPQTAGPSQFELLPTHRARAVILHDGNY